MRCSEQPGVTSGGTGKAGCGLEVLDCSVGFDFTEVLLLASVP